jgi:hypothetical protein
MLLLVGAALVMQGQMTTATDHITGTATPKSEAGHEIMYGAADLVGAQQAYVLDRGQHRPAFVRSAATFQHMLRHLRAVSVAAYVATRTFRERVLGQSGEGATGLDNDYAEVEWKLWPATAASAFAPFRYAAPPATSRL